MHRRSVPRSLWLGVLELRWVRVERERERFEASRFDSTIGSFGWLVDCVGDRNAANGCETAVSSDPSHCGGCNTVCSTLNVAAAVCVNGVCNPACKPGNAHCSGTMNTGCETSILSDISTCVGWGSCWRGSSLHYLAHIVVQSIDEFGVVGWQTTVAPARSHARATMSLLCVREECAQDHASTDSRTATTTRPPMDASRILSATRRTVDRVDRHAAPTT